MTGPHDSLKIKWLDGQATIWFNLLMMKQTTRPRQSKLPLIALIIAIVSLLSTVAVALVARDYISSQEAFMESNARVHIEESMRLIRLELCYADNIHPCDQETINKFYESQPQEQ